MSSDPDKLIKKHDQLIHSEMLKVTSHVQRRSHDWMINTLMLEGIDVPFKYKRKRKYKSLEGAQVNLTYYRDSEQVAGFDMEVMTVVRIKRA